MKRFLVLISTSIFLLIEVDQVFCRGINEAAVKVKEVIAPKIVKENDSPVVVPNQAPAASVQKQGHQKVQHLVANIQEALDDKPTKVGKRDDSDGEQSDKIDSNGKYTGGFNEDCFESMVISKDVEEVNLSVEKSILQVGGVLCHWNIIGADSCIPKIKCSKFKLNEDDGCDDEYFEVSDGSQGYKKFCGGDSPDGATNGNNARDMYITMKLSDSGGSRQFKCDVTCSTGKGKALDLQNEPEVDSSCKCGRKPNSGKKRLAGGEDAEKSDFPWMAALVTSGTRKPFCGGALINNQFIITAAHCFKGPYINIQNLNVMLSAQLLSSTDSSVASGGADNSQKMDDDELAQQDEEDGSYRFKPSHYYIHPLYNKQTNDFDVAVIKLEQPVDLQSVQGVSPICLPSFDQYTEEQEGKDAIISGFGLPSHDAKKTMPNLQSLELPVMPRDKCEEFYESRFTERMICAGFEEGGKDSCKGDSGGPLVSEKGHFWELIGVVSFGEGCAAARKPGVYINTRQVAQWVRYVTNMDGASWCQDDSHS